MRKQAECYNKQLKKQENWFVFIKDSVWHQREKNKKIENK